jgi:hypothetical protein
MDIIIIYWIRTVNHFIIIDVLLSGLIGKNEIIDHYKQVSSTWKLKKVPSQFLFYKINTNNLLKRGEYRAKRFIVSEVDVIHPVIKYDKLVAERALKLVAESEKTHGYFEMRRTKGKKMNANVFFEGNLDVDKPFDEVDTYVDYIISSDEEQENDYYFHLETIRDDVDKNVITYGEPVNDLTNENKVKINQEQEDTTIHSGKHHSVEISPRFVLNPYDNLKNATRSLLTKEHFEKLNNEQKKSISILLSVGFISFNKCYILNHDKVVLCNRFANADGDWIMGRNQKYYCNTGLEYKISRFNFRQINSLQ